jgi:hypothetical protein
MHTFRCTRCATIAYSATTLARLNADHCAHCGGELEAASRQPKFRASRAADAQAPERYALRPSARSSAG